MYTLSSLSPRKKAFLFSTLLLTASGFICRVLGFFYRIFLSRTIGAEGLGIYRTADGKRIFHRGIVLSMGMSLILSALICRYSDFLARYVLMAPECAPYLPVMGISVPFAAFHACINGYYYGVQKSRVPAFSQIAEQVIRMTLVFFLASSMIAAGKEITVELAVTGHLIGEIASALFTFLCLIFIPPQRTSPSAPAQTPAASISLPLLTLAFPLMGNRLVLNILASAEAVWIPNCLQRFGLSSVEAFSVYGVLTGMALPFILFPSAITNSMAVLLLPNVAQAQSEGKQERISSCIAMSLRYSLYMGILCTGIFILFGSALGNSVFHDPTAGRFIRILAWLCPFLYLSTTTGSILNGLGRTRTTFLHNTAALILRICFVLFGIPRFGILAYLWGMLASELFLSLLHLYALFRQIPFFWNAWEMIGKPSFFLLLSAGIHYFVSALHPETGQLPLFLETALQIFFFSFSYGGLLLVFHLGRLRDRP